MLVDSRTVVREGLCALIEQQSDLVVVAQAGSVRDAGRFDAAPDAIVTDVELPDAKYGEVISGLRQFFPETPILVLTLVDYPARVEAVLAAGANGYLLKTAASADLLAGIRLVAAGSTYLQSSLGVELARWHRPRNTALELSLNEERTLRLIALGHTNAEVAQLSGVSLRTVESHRARIHQKLGRRTRAELVQYARETGLVERDSQ